MEDNNSNLINPVQGLQNVQGSTPAKRREQKKRRQDSDQEKEQQGEQDTQDVNELFDDEQPVGNEPARNTENQHKIDYRA